MNQTIASERTGAGRHRTRLALFLAPAAVTLVLGSVLAFYRDFHWERMNLPLLAGSIAATAAVLAWSSRRTSPARLAAAAVVAAAIAWLAEFAGLKWGFLFGDDYEYHQALQPVLAGVPLFVLMSWFVIAQTGVNLVADRPAARSLLSAGLLGGLFVAAHAVLLDPLAVSVDAWQWLDGGRWFGTPVGNLAGWWVVGSALCLTTAGIQQRHRIPRRAHPAMDVALAATYFALMITATVAAHHRLGSSLPGIIALAITAPYWLRWLAARRTSRERALA